MHWQMTKFCVVNGEDQIYPSNHSSGKARQLYERPEITFAEPSEVQRRQLAPEFSTMKQRTAGSIDHFTFCLKK